MARTPHKTILQVAVPSPLRHSFDYLLPKNAQVPTIQPGMRVLVPFGKREVIGVILHISTNSQLTFAKLKTATAILDTEPLLSEKMLAFIQWISNYYHHPIGEVINNVLPKALRQTPVSKQGQAAANTPPNQVGPAISHKLHLNGHQQQAIMTIKQHLHEFKTFLLEGVTGSGKTEVYLRIIEEIITLQKQALILIPEINLTPQTISRFAARFTVKIAIFHSRLTLKERLQSWQLARTGEAPIIIGTRSAIFTPLKNPGIIIVDEEHDLSFKQQVGLRYSARDLAVVRGKLENVAVILGSATPSIESIYNSKRHRYISLTLPERAGAAAHPNFHLVDMRNQKLTNGIAANLVRHIDRHINQGGQVLIFLNRRGFAPILICHHCGWVAGCKHCDAHLTIHQQSRHLRCHHCGVTAPIPATCPQCAEAQLVMLGAGTERVELALQELLPHAKIIRIDRDTTKHKNSLEKILTDIHADHYQILVGTQMLAKGHHFPKVTMAAILNVDQSLFGLDFRASEHLAQLIIQVAGRAGREALNGEVYLQTHNPHHPLLLNLINGGYASFVNNCLEERQSADLPPYSHLALLQAESKNQEPVFEFLTSVSTQAKLEFNNEVKIFGPVATMMERKAGYFRAQLLLQSSYREKLQQALAALLTIIARLKPSHKLRWFLDVDPMELNS